MSVLLLRLAGPMQSWGTRSRFSMRDTEREPSKSGVVGLLCAALGRKRNEQVDDLASLRMGLRVDREGQASKDYQTALDVAKASGTGTKDCEPSERFYLADASFLVGLEGDADLLVNIDAALADPVWPLYLGRKSYVPSEPVHVGIVDGGLRQVLSTYPLANVDTERAQSDERLRLVLECEPSQGGEARLDQPICFVSEHRRFGLRYVKHDFIPRP